MMMLRYPSNSKEPERKDIRNPALTIFGNRVHLDQTLYEYLLEFLLVFSSAKNEDGSGKMSFHAGEPLSYYVEPRIGLRRFIFYEHARKNVRIKSDEDAYAQIRDIIKRHVKGVATESTKEVFVDSIQDLFRGYSAVLKKRSWCAQSLLPLCPEMIFCEEMPNDSERTKKHCGMHDDISDDYECESSTAYCDSGFDCKRHNFFARGGELYYLHLMQALEGDPESRVDLENKLRHLLTSKSHQFSQLASWIQKIWVEEMHIAPSDLIEKMTMGYLPQGAYLEDGSLAVRELRCYLSNDLHPVKRIELLTQGVMLQILRMLSDRASQYTGRDRAIWIVDMRGTKRDPTIRQLSALSYTNLNEIFTDALTRTLADQYSDDPGEQYKTFVMGRKESVDLFRARGKDIKLIIPARGNYERFSISEDIARFLVLSIIKPGDKMDLDTFLDELYHHFRMVIGPIEYQKSSSEMGVSTALSDSFNNNRYAFQEFLKSIGCLRDLSDATSIVVNPYEEAELR